MTSNKKLVIMLIILSLTLALLVTSLAIVLVDSPQGFETPFDIEYIVRVENFWNTNDSANDTNFISIDVVPGQTITLSEMELPYKVGYYFEGWYTDPSFTNRANDEFVVTKDSKLYAKFLQGNVVPNYYDKALGVYKYIKYNNGSVYEVIDYDESDNLMVFPDYYNDGTNGVAPVTYIDSEYVYSESNEWGVDYWYYRVFEGISTVTKIYLGRNMSFVGYNSIYNCSNLQQVVISNSEFVNNGAFGGQSKLMNMDVAPHTKDLVEIDDKIIDTSTQTLIAYKAKDTHFTVGEDILKIGSYAKYGDTGIVETVTIPDWVTSLGTNSVNFSTVKTLTIGAGITSLGFQDYMTGLEEMYYNVTFIDRGLHAAGCLFERAGWNSGGFTFYVGANVTAIPSRIFRGWSEGEIPTQTDGAKINSIVFAEGSQCTYIGPEAFYECLSITSVTGLTGTWQWRKYSNSSGTSSTVKQTITGESNLENFLINTMIYNSINLGYYALTKYSD